LDLLPPARGSPLLDRAADLGDSLQALADRLETDADLDAESRRRIARNLAHAEASVRRLRERVDREIRRSQGDAHTQAMLVWSQVLPGGALQERRWNIFHHLSKHGPGFLDALLDAARSALFSTAHHLVLVEGKGAPADAPALAPVPALHHDSGGETR
jgi:uncharacterized protein YllA (UPF0747 family)